MALIPSPAARIQTPYCAGGTSMRRPHTSIASGVAAIAGGDRPPDLERVDDPVGQGGVGRACARVPFAGIDVSQDVVADEFAGRRTDDGRPPGR